MNGENYPENSIPQEFGLTNSNPKDIDDQNESNQFTQPFPRQGNDLFSFYWLNEIQNFNYLINSNQNNAYQLYEEMINSIHKPPLENTESQNVPQHPEEIIAENPTRPRRTKKPPKPKIIRKKQ